MKYLTVVVLIIAIGLLSAQDRVLYGPSNVKNPAAGTSDFRFNDTVPVDFSHSTDGVSITAWNSSTAAQPYTSCRGAGCFYNGKHYVFGGFGVGDTDRVSFVYTYSTNSWASYSPAIPNAVNNTCYTFTGTKFWVFGSYSSSRVIQILDFTTNTWNTSRTIPTSPAVPYAGHQGCYIGGNKHFVTGAYLPSSSYKKSWIYDDAADSWISAPDWPGTGSYLYFNNNCAYYNGKVYVVGGYNGSTSGYTGVHVYDPTTNSWATGPTLPSGVNFNTAVSNPNGVYNVGSGWSSFGPATNKVYFLKQGTGSWVEDEPLPSARGSMPNTSCDGYNFLVSGGTSGSSRMSTAWYGTGKSVGFYESRYARFIPSSSNMLKLYPNPSRERVLFGFEIADKDHMKNVNITIYDLSGKAIKTLINENRSFGYHGVYWYNAGEKAGVYFYKMTVGGNLIASGKITKI